MGFSVEFPRDYQFGCTDEMRPRFSKLQANRSERYNRKKAQNKYIKLQNMANEMLLYEQRAVLFMDILGFSDLIKEGKGLRLLAALQHLQGRALEVQDLGRLDFTAFSDCVVVSAPIADGKGALQIVAYAQFLALDLLSHGFLTRGAVVSGNLYHQDRIVMGPALVDAYRLESKKALYPRIVVAPNIMGLAANAILSISPPVSHIDTAYFREDFDGMFHVDIFSRRANAPEAYWANGDGGIELNDRAFRDAVLLYIDRIFAKPPPQVAEEKYAWLANYFFEKCQENLWPLPDNLPISDFKREPYEQTLRDIAAEDSYGD